MSPKRTAKGANGMNGMNATGAGERLPTIALVGRPNVGKSTLFNRIVGRRIALEADEPGTTRDRRYGEGEWGGRRFALVDTGGVDRSGKPLTERVTSQALQATREADLVLFMMDARAGAMPEDRDLAGELRRLGKQVLVVASKIDTAEAEALSAAAWELGFDEVVSVSGVHGRGVGNLLDRALELLDELVPPDAPVPADEDASPQSSDQAKPRKLRLSFLGKPNAGKSSLVNLLLGEERVVVDGTPGTTRDPIDTEIVFQGKPLTLVDTAGIRKKRTSFDRLEGISVQMALDQVISSTVVALVIDGTDGPSEQDARLANLVAEKGRGLLLVITKMDLVSADKRAGLEQRLDDELRHVMWAPRLFVSALKGRGADEILGAAEQVAANHGKRLGTSETNRLFEDLLAANPPPLHRGRPVRIFYVTQTMASPPTFVAYASHPESVSEAYRKYLVREIRKGFGFEGTPVRLICRARSRTTRQVNRTKPEHKKR